MKLTKKELRHLIENFLFEVNTSNEKKGYEIYFAARDMSGYDVLPEALKVGHSWVMVKKPGEGITSYSGKSGIDFSTSAALKRFSSGRNVNIDIANDVFMKAYEDGTMTAEQIKKALEKADWGVLKKLKNWKSDTFAIANSSGNYLIPLTRKNDSLEDVKSAIEKIESSYNSYKEDSPYDPLPTGNDSSFFYGTFKQSSNFRNSNSFAYTLLLRAFGTDEEIKKRIGDINMHLPGFGLEVPRM